MQIKELLTALGIPEDRHEEAIKQVNAYLDGQYVTKSRFNEVNEAKKALDGLIADRDKQLKDLKKLEGDKDAFQARIKELEEANKKAKADAEEQIKAVKIDSAIKIALADSAQDVDIVSSLIDKTKLIVGEDGKLTGLGEQLETLKETKSFLFKVPKGEGKQSYTPNGGVGNTVNNPWAKETFNMTEQGRILKENPEQARALAASVGKTI